MIAMSARTPSSPRRGPPSDLRFDGPLALQHESERDEELSRGGEVVDHDADVLHPLDSHVFDGKEPDSGRACESSVNETLKIENTAHTRGANKELIVAAPGVCRGAMPRRCWFR